MIDALESRTLLTATLNNGVLTITSAYAGETYTIVGDGTTYTLTIQDEGFRAQYPESGVSSIILNAHPGTAGDEVDFTDGVTAPATINPNAGDDIILLGSGNSSVTASAGADSIVGGAGNDILHGGDGRAAANGIPAADDTIYGGAGNDQLFGDGSPVVATLGSILIGGAGNDTIQGGAGRDIMDGGAGTNTLDYTDHTTGLGVNIVFPNPANPAFVAGDPMNPISPTNFPFLGDGTVVAGTPSTVYVENEHDQLYAGLDSLPANAVTYDSITRNRTALISDSTFTVIQTGPTADEVDVSSPSNTAAYTISTGDGIDNIIGSPQNDVINTGDATGLFRNSGVNTDEASGQAGNDLITGGDSFSYLYGGDGNDTLLGGAGNDQLTGNNGNDSLDGGAGSDLMVGGDGVEADADGNDTLLGGPGGTGDTDTLQGDGGIDTAD